jgi:hypothetical protein
MRNTFKPAFFFTVWLTCACAGLFMLVMYSKQPGLQALAPTTWPSVSKIMFNRDSYNLVLLAHPKCPCSYASIEELDGIISRVHGSLKLTVLMFRPKDFPINWEHTILWKRALQIPGTAVFTDIDGSEAKIFGAKTSGQVLLYDRNRVLVFNGGITISRGHSGDNLGKLAVIDWILTGHSSINSTPVFGCNILNNTRSTEKE